jgi:hypothetical protein
MVGVVIIDEACMVEAIDPFNQLAVQECVPSSWLTGQLLEATKCSTVQIVPGLTMGENVWLTRRCLNP